MLAYSAHLKTITLFDDEVNMARCGVRTCTYTLGVSSGIMPPGGNLLETRLDAHSHSMAAAATCHVC